MLQLKHILGTFIDQVQTLLFKLHGFYREGVLFVPPLKRMPHFFSSFV